MKADDPIDIGAREYIDALRSQIALLMEQWAAARAEVLTLRRMIAAQGEKADVVPIRGAPDA